MEQHFRHSQQNFNDDWNDRMDGDVFDSGIFDLAQNEDGRELI